MGLVKDLATYAIKRATGGGDDKQSGEAPKTAQRGETPGQESLDRAASGPDQKKRSTASDLAKIGEKRLESSSGKRSSGVNTSQYSVGSMGLTGSIPGQEADLGDNSNARRKRSNGKDRG